MKKRRPPGFLHKALTLILATQSILLGAVVPERWEKVEGLSAGVPVTVRLKSGDRFVGNFRALTSDALIIDRPGETRPFEVVRSEVCRIHSVEKVRDSPFDGLWKGAAAGAAVSTPFVIWWLGNRDGDDVGSLTAGIVTLSLIVGTAVGGAVDAFSTSQKEFYRAGSC